MINSFKSKNNLKCKYCESTRINKNGIVKNGNQRYICRDSKRNFTITIRKYSNEYKMKIIKMYLENIGIRSIERLEGVPNTTVLKWIRSMGKIVKNKLQETINSIEEEDMKKENIEILECDEIVTYVKKNSKIMTQEKEILHSYGLLLIGTKIILLDLK